VPERPLTVLIVDDDEQILELMYSFLEQRGVEVMTASDADQALALPNLESVNVALLDIQLPGTSGHALQQELNRRFPDMAKIVMSGQADLDDAIAAFSDQAFTFVKKPFSSLKEIAVLIQRAAESKRLEIENREYAKRLHSTNIELEEKVSEQTAAAQHYQRILTHLFNVSSAIGRVEPANNLLDFVCRAVVEAGAFRRAVILLGDERFLVRHVGAWQDGGVGAELLEQLRALEGSPLRPFEFGRIEEQIGGAIYARALHATTAQETPPENRWIPGDQLFVPILRQDNSIFGYLSVEAPPDGAKPVGEVVQLLEVLLSHGALHLEAQNLRFELKRRADELEAKVQERGAQLRLAEDRFTRLVNATTDIVYITDEHDKITFLNEAFSRQLGYVRENYIGRTFHRLLEEITTDSPANQRAIQQLADYSNGPINVSVEILTRQGDKRSFEIKRVISRQGETVKGSQGTIRDNTEQRGLVQQLVVSERLASTGRLAAGIAHEINNPLQAMVSQLKAAQNKLAAKEDPRENLEVIGEGIDRLRYIVGSMLDLHRNPGQSSAPIQLNEIAEKTAVLVRQQTREHSVRVLLDLAPKLPAVSGSTQELQQVILNLMLNAAEAMPNGGDLTVKTRALTGSVEISFSDTGVGIPLDNMPQIFEPFFTQRPAGTGTGLGLYLCKNIVEAHQGKISVESAEGKGTTFTITLPRR
jgi:PAS domain S-box-containing protein